MQVPLMLARRSKGMAYEGVDRLSLEVTSSSSDIKKTVADINAVKEALTGFKFNKNTEKAMTAFATSLGIVAENTAKIDTGKITAFANAMSQLSTIKVSLPKGLGENIANIQKSFNEIDSKGLFKKVDSFARIMKPLLMQL